jgi:hypothetical protein
MPLPIIATTADVLSASNGTPSHNSSGPHLIARIPTLRPGNNGSVLLFRDKHGMMTMAGTDDGTVMRLTSRLVLAQFGACAIK